MKIRLLKLVKLPAANDHFQSIDTFNIGEVVEYKGELEKDRGVKTFRQQFLKIYRMKSKRDMQLSRKYFEKIGNWEFDKIPS